MLKVSVSPSVQGHIREDFPACNSSPWVVEAEESEVVSGCSFFMFPKHRQQQGLVAKAVIRDIREAETGGSSIQASLGNLVRLCFKIKSVRRASGCRDI